MRETNQSNHLDYTCLWQNFSLHARDEPRLRVGCLTRGRPEMLSRVAGQLGWPPDHLTLAAFTRMQLPRRFATDRPAGLEFARLGRPAAWPTR